MTELRASGGKRRKEVTGWTVFVCLVAFFAVVAGVNAIMIRAAISTFGGVETESSYKAGLAFSREVAAARAQDSRHWDVRAVVTPRSDGQRIEVTARDADGRPLAGLTALARFNHPADRRADMVLDMHEVASPGGRSRPPASGISSSSSCATASGCSARAAASSSNKANRCRRPSTFQCS